MTGPRLRVVQVVQNLNYGGMERVLADLVLGLDPAEFESHVVVLQYVGRFGDGLEGRATIHQVPPMNRLSMVDPGPLRRVLVQIGPDVVHSHSGVWYKASLAARRNRVPLILHTEHGRKSPDPWSDRVVDRFASRRTNGVIAVSGVLAAHLTSVVRVRCPVFLIPNGIDTAHFRPLGDDGCLRRELGLCPATPIVGSIGRLEPIKGYDVLIRAFAEIPERPGQPPVLVVAGDGSDRAALGALAASLGIADRVHLLGWRDDTLSLLGAFTLFTMSSRSEGTSISLLEAMSAGLCPVVTDVGGNAAVLGSRLAHRLVPTESPAALAAGLADCLDGGEARDGDARLAREVVVDRFGSETMVARYADLYRRRLPPWSPG
jgi:glycosyltransferase involved in cell wall biosynthesis